MLRINKKEYKRRLMLLGVSSKELASIAGLHVTTVSRAINGRGNTDPVTIGKIAQALKCEPVDILEEVEE